jgi:hypothetical protein
MTCESLVVVFLPTGQALALTATALAQALATGAELLGVGRPGPGVAPAQPPLAGQGVPEWVDARTLARRTGTDPRLWRSRAAAGELPHKRVGRRILFPASVFAAEPRVTAPAAVAPDEVVTWIR